MILALSLLLSEAWDSPPAFDAKARTVVQVAVKDRLLDGDSAKWRWLPFLSDGNTVAQYCGFLNSKNRMGGYSGFNPFWITGYWKAGAFTPVAAEFAEGPYLDSVAARMCKKAGYSLEQIPPETP